jgi:hypothetical protein
LLGYRDAVTPVPFRGLALAAASSLLLAGCVFGTSRESFVSGADRACRRTADRIAALARPSDPRDAMGYAIDVYTEKDRLLTHLNEMNLPGEDAAALRERWLDPASRDLQEFRPHLTALRQAVRKGDGDGVRAQLDALATVGTGGVDDGMLAAYGLDRCRQLFGEPAQGR